MAVAAAAAAAATVVWWCWWWWQADEGRLLVGQGREGGLRAQRVVGRPWGGAGGVGCSRAFFLSCLCSAGQDSGAKKLSRWSESSVEASEQRAGAVQCDAVRCGAVQCSAGAGVWVSWVGRTEATIGIGGSLFHVAQVQGAGARDAGCLAASPVRPAIIISRPRRPMPAGGPCTAT